MLSASAAQAASHSLEFLYIDANEGSASGGHAALKFDKQIFHFQHVEPGLLRLFRDEVAAFEFAYGHQENRTIYGHKIEVTDDFFISLRDLFTRRLLIQNQQFAALQALYDDQNLIAALLNSDKNWRLPLRGLGYFLARYRAEELFGQTSVSAKNASPQLKQLRQAIENKFGEDFLVQKRQQAWHGLQTLRPDEHSTFSSALRDNESFIATNTNFARRYSNQLLNLAALDVLHSASPVREDQLLHASLPALKLPLPHLAKLAAYRDQLFADLIKLVQSQRTDWGFPLLVGMARLQAIDRSIDSGYLVVLDRSEQQSGQPQDASVDASALPAALQYTEQVFANATAELTEAEGINERDYADLELSATALVQLQHSEQPENGVRLPRLTSTPTHPAAGELIDLPLTRVELASHKNLVASYIETFQERLMTWYEYQLVGRNCVTEIFKTINAAVASTAKPEQNPNLSLLSQQLLGGYIAEQGLHLIPFVAYSRVAEEYHVSTSAKRTPYREQQRRKRYRETSEWLVDLQESNPFSSSIYHWNSADSAFLFFTQDQIWPRPILGSFNLAMASGQGLYGLFSWPWDGGDNLHKSLKGIFVSVPELLFFNIRKGSFPNLLPNSVPE